MMDKLEAAIDDSGNMNEAHDKIFGKKDSLVDALVTLTDLATQLGEVQKPEAESQNSGEEIHDFPTDDKGGGEEYKLTECDVKIIRQFIDRGKLRYPDYAEHVVIPKDEEFKNDELVKIMGEYDVALADYITKRDQEEREKFFVARRERLAKEEAAKNRAPPDF